MNRLIHCFALAAAVFMLLVACGIGGGAVERPNVEATVAVQVQATVAAGQSAKPTAEATDAPAAEATTEPTETNAEPTAKPTQKPTVVAAVEPTSVPAGGGAEPGSQAAACANVPIAPAQAGQMSVPAISLKYGGKVTGFPNASQDALVAQFADKALVDGVVSLETYEGVDPATVAAEYAGKLASLAGWQSVLTSPTTPIAGNDRHAILFSDGTTDLFIIFEPTASFPTAETPVAPSEVGEVQQSVAGSQTVRVGYAGKGIAQALCNGALPKLFALGAATTGDAAASTGARAGELVAPPGSGFVADLGAGEIAARYGAGAGTEKDVSLKAERRVVRPFAFIVPLPFVQSHYQPLTLDIGQVIPTIHNMCG